MKLAFTFFVLVLTLAPEPLSLWVLPTSLKAHSWELRSVPHRVQHPYIPGTRLFQPVLVTGNCSSHFFLGILWADMRVFSLTCSCYFMAQTISSEPARPAPRRCLPRAAPLHYSSMQMLGIPETRLNCKSVFRFSLKPPPGNKLESYKSSVHFTCFSCLRGHSFEMAFLCLNLAGPCCIYFI